MRERSGIEPWEPHPRLTAPLRGNVAQASPSLETAGGVLGSILGGQPQCPVPGRSPGHLSGRSAWASHFAGGSRCGPRAPEGVGVAAVTAAHKWGNWDPGPGHRESRSRT